MRSCWNGLTRSYWTRSVNLIRLKTWTFGLDLPDADFDACYEAMVRGKHYEDTTRWTMLESVCRVGWFWSHSWCSRLSIWDVRSHGILSWSRDYFTWWRHQNEKRIKKIANLALSSEEPGYYPDSPELKPTLHWSTIPSDYCAIVRGHPWKWRNTILDTTGTL